MLSKIIRILSNRRFDGNAISKYWIEMERVAFALFVPFATAIPSNCQRLVLVLGLKINPHHLSVFVMWLAIVHTLLLLRLRILLSCTWTFNLEDASSEYGHLKFIHCRSLSLPLPVSTQRQHEYIEFYAVLLSSHGNFSKCVTLRLHHESWAELAQNNTTQQSVCKAEAAASEWNSDASGAETGRQAGIE